MEPFIATPLFLLGIIMTFVGAVMLYGALAKTNGHFWALIGILLLPITVFIMVYKYHYLYTGDPPKGYLPSLIFCSIGFLIIIYIITNKTPSFP